MGTWRAVSLITTVGFLSLSVLAGVRAVYQQEVAYRHFTSPISPVSMTAYAYTEPEKPLLTPKFDLAVLPERQQNMGLIRRIWGRQAYIGLAIARCESGYRTHAENNNTNGTQDQGVFQVNTIHNMPDMENAVANISYAYTIFLAQGTAPWNSSKHCWGGTF